MASSNLSSTTHLRRWFVRPWVVVRVEELLNLGRCFFDFSFSHQSRGCRDCVISSRHNVFCVWHISLHSTHTAYWCHRDAWWGTTCRPCKEVFLHLGYSLSIVCNCSLLVQQLFFAFCQLLRKLQVLLFLPWEICFKLTNVILQVCEVQVLVKWMDLWCILSWLLNLG